MASVEERVAVIEATLRDIQREVDRTRERVHELRGMSGAIDVLTTITTQMREEMAGLRKEVGGLRRVMLGWAFTIAGGMTVFALTIFTAFR